MDVDVNHVAYCASPPQQYVSSVKDHEKAVAEEHKLKEKLNNAIHKHEEGEHMTSREVPRPLD